MQRDFVLTLNEISVGWNQSGDCSDVGLRALRDRLQIQPPASVNPSTVRDKIESESYGPPHNTVKETIADAGIVVKAYDRGCLTRLKTDF